MIKIRLENCKFIQPQIEVRLISNKKEQSYLLDVTKDGLKAKGSIPDFTLSLPLYIIVPSHCYEVKPETSCGSLEIKGSNIKIKSEWKEILPEVFGSIIE